MKRGDNMKKAMIGTLCSVVLMFAVVSAQATTIGLLQFDDYYVGSINDGIPSSPGLEIGYINNLIGLAPGASNTPIGTEIYNREGSDIATLPTVGTWNTKDEVAPFSFVAPFDGSFYVLAKYDAAAAGSLVWLVDALAADIFTAQANYNDRGLSHISAYGNASVPEPMTLILLGFGLVGLAGFSRRFKK